MNKVQICVKLSVDILEIIDKMAVKVTISILSIIAYSTHY